MSVFTLRAGAGGRARIVIQTISPTRATPGTSDETKSAFAFGPEVVLGARLAMSPTWFADLAATGSLAFLREEETLTGLAGATGSPRSRRPILISRSTSPRPPRWGDAERGSGCASRRASGRAR